ncbi:hypothetical protein B0T19DRAFT_445081 [Cercophora scortea]|uniref:LysM domain-containing protein n=1 Tax=Cercophora scortea TaxID=314031 RepID=A0AAE0IA12_9PEZI|nr:hypothetical protein B0T19DRAFT_445081 [Cercophora scortea]
MRFLSIIVSTLFWWNSGLAQDDGPANYTDKASGIVFNTWRPTKDLTFGMALPASALTVDATEFIGILTCSSPTGKATGWCGVSLGGGMNSNLLLVAYPQQNTILTSFRWATDYHLPAAYTGAAKLTQISSTINATHYSLLFRCQNCLKWSQGAESGSAPTSEGYLVLGWCHATSSPVSGTCPASLVVRQHNDQGIFPARFNSGAVNAAYASWAAKATNTVTGSCGNAATPGSSTSTRVTSTAKTAPMPTPTPASPGSCAKTYTVKAGDYCYLIATNNGITLDQLYRYNPALVCNPLQVGAVVCVQGR